MKSLFFLISILLLFSCTQEKKSALKVDGLWKVNKVKIGSEEMTPIARWMQFNADSTQTSGNGWLQHSVGSWSLKNKNQLKVNNSNGLIDEYEPFTIAIQENKMTWNREEEGQKVKVFLERIDDIPASNGNKLMGQWKLESKIIADNKDVNSEIKSIYLSWDNRFIKQFVSGKKEYGIYKIHAHKPELQLVNYGDNPKFTFYKFSFEDDNLILQSSDKEEELVLSRIHKFLK